MGARDQYGQPFFGSLYPWLRAPRGVAMCDQETTARFRVGVLPPAAAATVFGFAAAALLTGAVLPAEDVAGLGGP